MKRSICIVATLAWGAFSFGAVYPWAYWPLLIASGGIGIIELVESGGAITTSSKRLMLAFAVVVVAVLFQLIPIPRDAIVRLSPATDALLRQYDLAYATASGMSASATSPGVLTDGDVRHALSIDPGATWRGLFFLVGLALLFLGTQHIIGRDGPQPLVRGLIALGVMLALLGIVQKAVYSGKVYGFWQSEFKGDPFGPFINRNHFAGWMLMAVPVALVYFLDLAASELKRLRGRRGRLLWLSSSRANEAIIVVVAVLVMGLSLVLTLSRSGIFCFLVVLAVAGVAILRTHSSRWQRFGIAACLAVVPVSILLWAGADIVAARFAELSGSGLSGRLGAWGDAARIAGAFPLIGTGFNTYGVATLFYQTFDLGKHYYEAHNDYLQLAAEGGLLVAIPTSLLLCLFIVEVRRQFRHDSKEGSRNWYRLGAMLGLVGIGLQELFEFSLQIPGNAALFVVLCAMAITETDPEVRLKRQ